MRPLVDNPGAVNTKPSIFNGFEKVPLKLIAPNTDLGFRHFNVGIFKMTPFRLELISKKVGLFFTTFKVSLAVVFPAMTPLGTTTFKVFKVSADSSRDTFTRPATSGAPTGCTQLPENGIPESLPSPEICSSPGSAEKVMDFAVNTCRGTKTSLRTFCKVPTTS